MRIAIDVRVLGVSKFAGISAYVRQFLRLASRKKDLEIFALSDSEIEVPDNVHLLVKKPLFTFLWDQLTLPKMLSDCKADVFLNPLIKAPLSLPCPMAWIINDLNHIVVLPEYSGSDSKLRQLYFGFLARQALKKKPCIGAISFHTASLFAKEFCYPIENISIINLSAEFDEKSETDINTVKNKYNLPKRFILYLGNFRKHKNVLTLVQSYAQLPDKLRSEVKLVLAGEKEFEYENLLKFCQKLNISSSLVFTGTILERDKQLLYRLAEIFVLPSVSEGFGLPLIEAMSQGTAVLAANAAALPEIVQDNEMMFSSRDTNALANRLHALLSDSLKRESLQKKITDIAHSYSPEKTVEQIIGLCMRASK